MRLKPGQPADGEVAQGKELIRLHTDNFSIGARATRAWHRLTWRGPLNALRFSKPQPLQLLAVPDEQILGDAQRGDALLSGQLRWMQDYIGVDAVLGGETPLSPALADYFHSFAWVRDLSSVASRKDAAPIAETLASAWLNRFGARTGEGWRPDLCGWRILFATAHAPLLLADPDLRAEMLKMLAQSARHVSRTANQAAEGLPRIAAWCGVVASGLLLPNNAARLVGGEAGLIRTLRVSITDDGGLVSRSPVEQFDFLSLLVMVKAAYEAAPDSAVPQFLSETIARAAPALVSAAHGPSGLSGFQGSPPIADERIQSALSASGILARGGTVMRDWGYQQLSAGPVRIILDAGPPPASRHAQCGSASPLAIEISDGAERLITSCGGASALSGDNAERLAIGLRSTAAHSALCVAETNSNAVRKDGTLGPGVSELSFSKEDRGDFTRLSASHDGYAERFGFETRRVLSIDKLGRAIRGEDMLIPLGQGKGGKNQIVHIRFHAGPGVVVTKAKADRSAELQLPSGITWRFLCSEGDMTIEPSLWVDASGALRQTAQICIASEAPPGGLALSWSLERNLPPT